METKLNSYTLLDDSIKIMRDILNKSRKDKKEVGLTMCSKEDNVITLRGEQHGDTYQIPIKRQCNKGEEYVGYYHTHRGLSKASSADLRLCGTSKILCIGGKAEQKGQGERKNDNISCYTWKDKVISIQEGEHLFIDVHKGKKEPRNPEHKPHFNCLNTIGIYAEEQEILEDKLKSIGFSPIIKLAIMFRSIELSTLVDKEVDKYYNRTEIKIGKDKHDRNFR